MTDENVQTGETTSVVRVKRPYRRHTNEERLLEWKAKREQAKLDEKRRREYARIDKKYRREFSPDEKTNRQLRQMEVRAADPTEFSTHRYSNATKLMIYCAWAQGKGYGEIAQKLGISRASVQTICNGIRGKICTDADLADFIAGARVKLRAYLLEALDNFVWHIQNPDSPKNYEASERLLVNLGVLAYGQSAIAPITVNVAVIEKQRDEQIKTTLEKFGVQVVDRNAIPSNGGAENAQSD